MSAELDRIEQMIDSAESYAIMFGVSGGDVKSQLSAARNNYRLLLKAVHPDRVDMDARDKATDLTAKLNKLYEEAQAAIQAGTLHVRRSNSSAVFSSAKYQYRVTEKFTKYNDMAECFLATAGSGTGELSGFVKVARTPADNELLATEAEVLKKICDGSDAKREVFFPTLLDSFGMKIGTKRLRANTLANLDGFYNLEQVRERYVNGVQDLDMAWMWRRVLWTLDYAHTKGVVHGAVLPQHVMLQPAQHGIVLVDWCYASPKRGKDHQPLKAVVGRQRAWYPKYVFDKQPAMPALDIAMGARTMVYIVGGDPETGKMPPGVKLEFARYFAGILAREGDTKLRVPEVAVEFDAILERLRGPYFPRKFRPFDMGSSNK